MSQKKAAVKTASLPSQTTDHPTTEQSPVEQPAIQEAQKINTIEKKRKEELVAAIEARRKAACGE